MAWMPVYTGMTSVRNYSTGLRIARRKRGPAGLRLHVRIDHEDHRRAFALGDASRLSVADGEGAGPAARHVELGHALSHRNGDGGILPRKWGEGDPRPGLCQVPAARGDARAARLRLRDGGGAP